MDARPVLLIVDDEVPQMHALADVLAREGYRTLACATAEEALRILGSEPCDVLLSDLRMPGTDGIELIRRAVERDPDLVAVLMTGHGSIASAVEAMRTGAIDYVLKPFRLEAMRPVLARALEVGRLRRHNRELQASLLERTRELEEANLELDAFAGRMAHDLQAPLRGIVGFAEILEDRAAAGLDAEQRGYLQRILAAGRRAEAMSRDLLAFARLGDSALKREEVELGEVLQEALRMTEPHLAGRALDAAIDPLPRAQVDASLMQQVFVNLLSNAIKFSAGADPVRIEVRCARDPALGHVLSFRDHGVGFDPAFADRLFAPFQRLHGSNEFEGHGMGLANVKRIVERHGGTVWAESEEGKGACFHVSIPDAA
jgi:signal transduction histidine kinase